MKVLFLTHSFPRDGGDAAGSGGCVAVGTFVLLLPWMSNVERAVPVPGSRTNISTRPFGAKVGPSLWKPSVSIRSPEPSGLRMPMENDPRACLVKAM